MFRIRFHGRGGQGMKTASRILGTALFLEGYEVQDAPRYGAERRGAPIFAYVRADSKVINERGIINHPDLVVIADDSLVALPAAGVLAGINGETVLLLYSHTDAATWRKRLDIANNIFVIPSAEVMEDSLESHGAGIKSAGAAAGLMGVVSIDHLAEAISQELSTSGAAVIERNILLGSEAFNQMQIHQGCVKEGDAVSAESYTDPEWTVLPFESAKISAPAIRGANTSELSQTGLWRTLRPIIDYDKCNRCWWVCSTLCPDGAMSVDDNGFPKIDLNHCKGCMVCVSVCPPQIIAVLPESEFAESNAIVYEAKEANEANEANEKEQSS